MRPAGLFSLYYYLSLNAHRAPLKRTAVRCWCVFVSSCVCFVALLWTEMHRHPDREGVPGASGRGEGHVQLPGLNASRPPALLSFIFYLFYSSFFFFFFFFFKFYVWVIKWGSLWAADMLWVCRRPRDRPDVTTSHRPEGPNCLRSFSHEGTKPLLLRPGDPVYTLACPVPSVGLKHTHTDTHTHTHFLVVIL